MSRPSILIVDDELLIRDLLYDFFADQGWSIKVAENGEKALEVLKTTEIDVLLTDIKMPDMDGLALAEQVNQQHPDLPVIIMTGYPSVETAVTALRQKVADYIIKPFNLNKLYQSVKAQIKQGHDTPD